MKYFKMVAGYPMNEHGIFETKTGKAWTLHRKGAQVTNKHWPAVFLPKSIVEFGEIYDTGWIEVFIPEWWVQKNGCGYMGTAIVEMNASCEEYEF